MEYEIKIEKKTSKSDFRFIHNSKISSSVAEASSTTSLLSSTLYPPPLIVNSKKYNLNENKSFFCFCKLILYLKKTHKKMKSEITPDKNHYTKNQNPVNIFQ